MRSYAYDWIIWGMFFVLPFVIFYQCATSLADQGAGSGGPMENAALFPRMIAWLLLGLAALNLFRLLTKRVSPKTPIEPTDKTRLALIVTGIFMAYLVILPILGYHIVTPALMTLLFLLFGLNALLSISGSIAISMGVAVVFQGLLNVVLPVGIFEITIFG